MGLIFLIVILVLVFGGGGGYYGYNRWGYAGGGGIGVGTILLILVVCWLLGVFHYNLRTFSTNPASRFARRTAKPREPKYDRRRSGSDVKTSRLWRHTCSSRPRWC